MSIFNSLPPKIKQYHLIKWLKVNYPFLNKKNLSLKKLNSERDKNYLIKINKINKMLKNSDFIKNAPDEVVKKQKESFMNYKKTLTKLEEAKKNISTN